MKKRLCTKGTASAAEVRFCETHRFAVSLEGAAVCFQPSLRYWVVLSNTTQD
jgi:hypothetical protein